MEPEGSLPHSQVPATCPYPEPARSSPYPPHPNSWRSILILSSHLRLGLPNGLFPTDFSTKTLYTPLLSPIRATCPAHLILLDFICHSPYCRNLESWVFVCCVRIFRRKEEEGSIGVFRHISGVLGYMPFDGGGVGRRAGGEHKVVDVT